MGRGRAYGQANAVHARLTPGRESYLRDLLAIGIGESKDRGPHRAHLQKLGWIEPVWESPAGQQVGILPVGPGASAGFKFIGMRVAPLGQAALSAVDVERARIKAYGK